MSAILSSLKISKQLLQYWISMINPPIFVLRHLGLYYKVIRLTKVLMALLHSFVKDGAVVFIYFLFLQVNFFLHTTEK